MKKKATYKSYIIKLIIFNLMLSFPFVASSQISRNGRYIYGRDYVDKFIIIKSTDSTWEKKISYGSSLDNPMFSPDSKFFFVKVNDTLYFQSLGVDNLTFKSNVSSFKQPSLGNGEWLAYQKSTINKELVLYNLYTKKEDHFLNVDYYSFSDDGHCLVIKNEIKQQNNVQIQLSSIDLNNGAVNQIWASNKGQSIIDIVMDNERHQLAFTVGEIQDDKLGKSIWYYREGMQKAELLVNNMVNSTRKGFVLGDEPLKFTKNGSNIFFSIKQSELPKQKSVYPNVDIWSYTDANIQGVQLFNLKPRNYRASISLLNRNIFQVEQENERVIGENGLPANDEFVLIVHFTGNILRDEAGQSEVYEYNWNKATMNAIYLFSLKDGTRRTVRGVSKTDKNEISPLIISPENKYVIYYDELKNKYKTYEISTGITRIISNGIPGRLSTFNINENEVYYPYIGWLEHDSAILIFDSSRDIWKLDSRGKKLPINISNGFAKKNYISFNVLWGANLNFNSHSKLVLNATNRKSLETGFYSITVNQKNEPKLLTMGAYLYRLMDYKTNVDKDIFLVKRESRNTPSEELFTFDLKTFTPINEKEDQSENKIKVGVKYFTWKAPNDYHGLLRGILYKPINFDPSKKYPVIFDFYEVEASHNFFKFPGFYDTTITAAKKGFAAINKLYYLNNGYIVFTPDIHYKLGQTGKSVCDALKSAAKIISKLSYVNKSKMGLCGHSFGAYETNFLITHTNLFAAACSSSGASDLISLFGTEERKSGHPNAQNIGQYRIGSNPWVRPDLYLKNSPIFYADKVTTPLLMMANQDDPIVPASQGIEFFTALRRCGKRVWMLQYEDEGHGLLHDKNVKDWDFRMKQFLDHYLKGAPAPVWMTQGIPASLKGIELRYEHDTAMKTPGPGLLMDKEVLTQQQKELLKHRTTVNNEGRIVDVNTSIKKGKLKKINKKKTI